MEPNALVSRTTAKELNLFSYYNGPCKYGHTSGRYTSNGSCIACVRNFADNNPDVNRKAVTAYQKRNPDKIKNVIRRWRAGNPEACRLQRQHRRETKGYYTKTDIQRMLQEQNDACNFCKEAFNGKYEVDHVKPIAKGGTNWPGNLQLLCRTCNAKKSDIYPYIYVDIQ